MQKFVYEYATKVYFGEGAVKEHLAAAVSPYGQNVMLAYLGEYDFGAKAVRPSPERPG